MFERPVSKFSKARFNEQNGLRSYLTGTYDEPRMNTVFGVPPWRYKDYSIFSPGPDGATRYMMGSAAAENKDNIVSYED